MEIHKFSEIEFSLNPSHFEVNKMQTIYVVASNDDGVWVNIKTGVEVDLD